MMISKGCTTILLLNALVHYGVYPVCGSDVFTKVGGELDMYFSSPENMPSDFSIQNAKQTLLSFEGDKIEAHPKVDNMEFYQNISGVKFRIKEITVSDAGVYNMIDIKSKDIITTVALVVLRKPENISVTEESQTRPIEDKPFKILCHVSSASKPDGYGLPFEYSWEESGRVIGANDTRYKVDNNWLEIRSVRKSDDQLKFTCQASETGGNITVSSDVSTEYSIKKPYYKPNVNITRKQKNGALPEILCTSDAWPIPSIFTLDNDGKQLEVKTTTGGIYYSNVKLKGVYKCTATNEAGTDSESLLIPYSPSIDVSSLKTKYNSVIGNNVTMNVTILAYPAPSTLEWIHKSKEGIYQRTLNSTTISVIKVDNYLSRLVIERVQESDLGNYTVSIKNSEGKSNVTIALDAAPLPTTTSTAAVTTGPASTSTPPTPTTVSTTSTPTTTITTTATTTTTTTTTTGPVTTSTKSTTTTASTTPAPSTTKTTTATTGPVTTSTSTRPTTAPTSPLSIKAFHITPSEPLETQRVTFACETSMANSSTKIVEACIGCATLKQGMGNITFNKTVTCEDTRNYTCSTSDGIRSLNESRELRVKCKPRVEKSELELEIYAILGESVTLSVPIVAYPEPNLEWTFITNENQRTVHPKPLKLISNNKFQSEMVLENVTKADFGNYTISVKNLVGESKITLILKQKALAPSSKTQHAKPESKVALFAGVGGAVGIVVILIVVAVVVFIVIGKRRAKDRAREEYIKNWSRSSANNNSSRRIQMNDIPLDEVHIPEYEKESIRPGDLPPNPLYICSEDVVSNAAPDNRGYERVVRQNSDPPSAYSNVEKKDTPAPENTVYAVVNVNKSNNSKTGKKDAQYEDILVRKVIAVDPKYRDSNLYEIALDDDDDEVSVEEQKQPDGKVYTELYVTNGAANGGKDKPLFKHEEEAVTLTYLKQKKELPWEKDF